MGGGTASGHAHPEVLKAVHEQIDKVTSTLDIPSEAHMKMVRTLRGILPRKLSRVFSRNHWLRRCSTGDKTYPGFNMSKDGVIAFKGAYHGMMVISLAPTSDSSHKDGIGSLVPGFQSLPFPYKFRNPFGYQEEGIDEFAANNLKRVLDDTHSGYSKPAAVTR